ncbi:MAG TPA: FeoA domain-containing protein [Candidatus Caccovivens faecavium]|nr:FeoA domain-containing protein [Candidatus Caccovivens faecavium]
MHSLREGKVNKSYKIMEVKGEEKVVRRFFELGIFTGQNIVILNKSPLKKVFLVEIRGYVLSIKSTLLGSVMVA